MATSWTLGAGLDNLILVQSSGLVDGASGTGNELDNLINAQYDHAGTLSGLGIVLVGARVIRSSCLAYS